MVDRLPCEKPPCLSIFLRFQSTTPSLRDTPPVQEGNRVGASERLFSENLTALPFAGERARERGAIASATPPLCPSRGARGRLFKRRSTLNTHEKLLFSDSSPLRLPDSFFSSIRPPHKRSEQPTSPAPSVPSGSACVWRSARRRGRGTCPRPVWKHPP